jgi:hypothetical protein
MLDKSRIKSDIRFITQIQINIKNKKKILLIINMFYMNKISVMYNKSIDIH